MEKGSSIYIECAWPHEWLRGHKRSHHSGKTHEFLFFENRVKTQDLILVCTTFSIRWSIFLVRGKREALWYKPEGRDATNGRKRRASWRHTHRYPSNISLLCKNRSSFSFCFKASAATRRRWSCKWAKLSAAHARAAQVQRKAYLII